MTEPATRPARRSAGTWPAGIAIAGTAAIACGAFYLSFASLTHLATLAGLTPDRAWVWPLLVDGMIVVATVAVATLRGRRRTAYGWALLAGGAAMSILGNAVHAALTAPDDVPPAIAIVVASTPPLVLVAITHLTVQLLRARPGPGTSTRPPRTVPPDAPELLTVRTGQPSRDPSARGPTPAPRSPRALPAAGGDPRERARALRLAGSSNRAIAQQLSVHPSTVGRWLAAAPPDTTTTEDPLTEGDADDRPDPEL